MIDTSYRRGVKGGQSIDAAEKDPAVVVLKAGAGIEFIALQAIFHGEAGEAGPVCCQEVGGRGEAKDASVAAHPECSVLVGYNTINGVIRQSLFLGDREFVAGMDIPGYQSIA